MRSTWGAETKTHWQPAVTGLASSHRYKAKLFLHIIAENPPWNSPAQPPREPSWHHCHLTEAHSVLLTSSIICFQQFQNRSFTVRSIPQTELWKYPYETSAGAIALSSKSDHDQAEQLAQLFQTQSRTTPAIYTSSAEQEEIVQGQVYTSHMTGALSQHRFVMSLRDGPKVPCTCYSSKKKRTYFLDKRHPPLFA